MVRDSIEIPKAGKGKSSPGGEDTGEGGQSFYFQTNSLKPSPVRPIKNISTLNGLEIVIEYQPPKPNHWS
jgi:hypothetical protein